MEVSHSLVSKPFVLLVDDDSDQLFVFKTFIEQKTGCKVLTANSAHQAEETLKQIHVDLVVTDINMPDVSGNELVSRLRHASDQLDLPVVSFSADTKLSRDEVLSYGANEFCWKSKPRMLVDSIERLLHGNEANKALLEQVQSRFGQK